MILYIVKIWKTQTDMYAVDCELIYLDLFFNIY